VWTTSFVKASSIEKAKVTFTQKLEVPQSIAEAQTTSQDGELTTTGWTDHNGFTTIAYPKNSTPGSEILIVQKGNDIAFMKGVTFLKEGKSFRKLLWHVFDGKLLSCLAHTNNEDRGTYRPTEEVHFKGYIRGLRLKKDDTLESRGTFQFAT
jgi:hypothetical protein